MGVELCKDKIDSSSLQTEIGKPKCYKVLKFLKFSGNMLITRVNLNRFTKIRVTGDRKMHFENDKMIYWIKICKMEENLISDGKFSVYFLNKI